MTSLQELEERILRLEKQNLELKRARKGLIVEPNLNILGQNTRIDGRLSVASNINLNEITTPSTPPSGQLSLYAKADGLPHVKNDAGVESPIALGGVWQDYTVNVYSSSGSISAYTAEGKYTSIGKICLFKASCKISNNGTGSGVLYLSRPPIVHKNIVYEVFPAIIQEVGSGALLYSAFGALGYSSGNFTIQKYDGTYPVATNRIVIISGMYEIA